MHLPCQWAITPARMEKTPQVPEQISTNTRDHYNTATLKITSQTQQAIKRHAKSYLIQQARLPRSRELRGSCCGFPSRQVPQQTLLLQKHPHPPRVQRSRPQV